MVARPQCHRNKLLPPLLEPKRPPIQDDITPKVGIIKQVSRRPRDHRVRLRVRLRHGHHPPTESKDSLTRQRRPRRASPFYINAKYFGLPQDRVRRILAPLDVSRPRLNMRNRHAHPRPTRQCLR